MRFRTRFSSIQVVGSLLALGFCGFWGCTPDVKEIRAQGVNEFRNRQYVESMATMRHVLDLSPNDAQGNYYMGLNYRASAARKFSQGDVTAARRELDTAITYFTQAVKSWPNYMAAVASKNEALEARGKYDEALSTAESVADNNRGIAEHYVYLANLYRDHGDYDNALRAYKLALSTDPESSKAYAGMGKLYMRIGDQANASDAFRQAQALDPREPVLNEEMASPPAEDVPRPASHEP